MSSLSTVCESPYFRQIIIIITIRRLFAMHSTNEDPPHDKSRDNSLTAARRRGFNTHVDKCKIIEVTLVTIRFDTNHHQRFFMQIAEEEEEVAKRYLSWPIKRHTKILWPFAYKLLAS